MRASFTELESFSLGWEGRLWLRENMGVASRSFTEGRAVLVAVEERRERRTFSKVQTNIDCQLWVKLGYVLTISGS